jgi:hypothetical protein
MLLMLFLQDGEASFGRVQEALGTFIGYNFFPWLMSDRNATSNDERYEQVETSVIL